MFKTYFFLEGPAGTDPFRLSGNAALEAIEAQVPAPAGYTQTRSLGDQVTDDPAAYAGVAELWFARTQDALASTAQAQSLSPLLADGVRVGPIVTGLARTVLRLPEHHDGGLIKGVFPFLRRSDLTVGAFQRYWWLNHGPIAALTEQAVYYLQCHPLEETYARGRPPYDGITELHWPDVAAARAAMASRQMTEDQSNDAKNFVEPDSVVLFLAAEEIVLAA